MKYDVRFSQPSFHLNRRRLLKFYGNGTVYLLETGLVADGQMPRVNLPFIDRIYHGVIGTPTCRSIPYSAILRHGVLRPWSIWIAKTFVLTVFSLLLAGLAVGLMHGGTLLLLIPLLVVAGLMVVTVMAGRPAYRISCSDQSGHKQDLYMGFHCRADRLEFKKELMRFIEQSRLSVPPNTSLFSKSELLTFSQPAIVSSRRNFAANWIISGLIHAWIWCLGTLLISFTLHLLLSATAGTSLAALPFWNPVNDAFYRPGVEIYAFFSKAIVVQKPAAMGALTFSGPVRAAIALWTMLAILTGAVIGVARPNPDLNSGRVFACAKWLPVVVGVIFIGWNARQYLLYSMVAESDSDSLVRPANYYSAPPIGPGHILYSQLDRDRQLEKERFRQMVFELIERASEFEEQKKFADAENELNRAIQLTREQRDTRQEASLLAMFGQSLYRRGRYQDAQIYFEQAIETSTRVSATSRDLAMIHNLVGLNLDELGKSAEAGAAFAKALSVLESSRESDPAAAAIIRLNYAQHFERNSDRASARQQLDEATLLMAGAGETSRPAAAMSCYTASAANLAALKRWGEAHNHASQAVRIAEQQGQSSEGALAAARSIQVMGFLSLVAMAIAVITITGLALSIAWAAGRRGYHTLLWFVVAAFSGFPMANLVVLASVPDRRLDMRRSELLNQLKKLQGAAKMNIPNLDIHQRSIGDRTTLE